MSEALNHNIETLVQLALAEDLGANGDVTSRTTISPDTQLCGQIVAKADGVIAGLAAVAATYRHVDPDLVVQPCVADGTAVTPGTMICEISGSAQSILTGERVALNFLQQLSGIATLTAQFVAAAAGTNAVILDTRKTTPGWRLLEKYAVRMGGGQNHRIGLYDMVMIKDNHIEAAGGITPAVNAVRADSIGATLPIEVEVETLAQLREALDLNVERILLDNMSVEMMREAVALTAGRTPLEASGNMTLQRIGSVAQTGVDYISVGALTHSAPALDLSMRLSRLT
ncbi:MAG: carboxylating nicotinate-nucleotide diphosphorylase [Chloroflexi bacterium]|nr:carboxylating nicotinate-nucleotide diphosphorylase [Chloroflexota bacterium]